MSPTGTKSAPAGVRRLAAAVHVEHLLLIVFLSWYIRVIHDWYQRLGDGLFHTNITGFSWVAGPAIVLLAIIIIQHLSAWFVTGDEAFGSAGRRLAARLLQVAGDWLPFLLFLSIYLMFNTRLMQEYQGTNRDALLADWEVRLLGGHLSLWTEKFSGVALTLIMQIFYMAYVVFTTPAAAVFVYLKDRRRFRALMLGLTVVALVGAVGYAKLPGAGPGKFLHDKYRGELPKTLMGKAMDYSIETARAPDDVFPSLHVAVSMLGLLHVRKTWRWAFWLLLPWIVGNWLSTVYLRYHYVIDCIAGALLAVAAYYAGLGLVRLEEGLKRRLSDAGAPPVAPAATPGGSPS
jgi:membrane-associated phospholipid phosphatase